MIVGIDGTRGINEKAGIGRYIRNLVVEMAKRDDVEAQFLFTAMRDKERKRKEIEKLLNLPFVSSRAERGDLSQVEIDRDCRGVPRNDKRERSPHYFLKSVPGEWKNTLWGGPVSWPDVWLPNVDLWHAPSIWEAPIATRKPLVVTIHDLTPFLFPELRGQKVSINQMKRTIKAVRRADHIICISEATRKDLLSIAPAIATKCTVVHLGVEERFKQISNIAKQKIILTVGTVEPRKNLQFLFKVYKTLPPKIQDEYQIWVVGAKGWRDSLIYEEAKTLADRVKFLGFVSDSELIDLYNKAMILAFSSLYEGFGLPILEAMACGLPVIANNISSMPEVIGEAGLLLPQKIEPWRDAIVKLLADTGLRQRLRLAGLERARDLTWQKMAQETVKIYHKVSQKCKVKSGG